VASIVLFSFRVLAVDRDGKYVVRLVVNYCTLFFYLISNCGCLPSFVSWMLSRGKLFPLQTVGWL
jgi:hypothetical protein